MPDVLSGELALSSLRREMPIGRLLQETDMASKLSPSSTSAASRGSQHKRGRGELFTTSDGSRDRVDRRRQCRLGELGRRMLEILSASPEQLDELVAELESGWRLVEPGDDLDRGG